MSADRYRFAPVSLARAAFCCRCPRCGEGRLFTGLLTVRPALPVLRPRSLGAGCRRRPGGVRDPLPRRRSSSALAAIVEIEFAPPIWVHLVLWTPLILGGAILMLRPLKAGLIALQYRHYLLHAPPAA